MSRQTLSRMIQELLASADIGTTGKRPWDIEIHNEEFYRRLVKGGTLALGESYMDGWWDCSRLDEFFFRVLRAEVYKRAAFKIWYSDTVKSRLLNLQKPSRAGRDVPYHYDIGNDLYKCMLGELMIYSCGYWETASTLEEAQEAKLDLACRKLDLRPGMELLDIGCGWGGAAKFAAEKYQVKVVGITISKRQAEYAKELCRGLPVNIRLQDYRDIHGAFDRVVSIGMFEHVGYKNYDVFMRIVRNCLKEDGLFLLHTIGGNTSVKSTDLWIDRYIFPHSMLPSAAQICSATEGLFVLEDWHCFGSDYDRTLMHWFQNFHDNWETLKKDYDDRFYRMWKYYLQSCAASFRARCNQLWQIVFSPRGVLGGYKAPRDCPVGR